MKTVLHLAHEHLEFRLPEVKSIAKIFGVDLKIPDTYKAENPFLVVDLPSRQHAINITKRSVLIKSAVELMVQADNHTSFFHKLANIDPLLTDTPSFRIKVETFNKTITQQDKLSIIDKVTSSGVDFKGKVILGDRCHTTYHFLEHYHHSQPHPQHIYFGKWICDGVREELKKYDLKKRKFIGNTTMDVTLSMIMANMAQAREGTLVYDPFVGTGSLLVSCAHYGSHVMGSEIDFNLVTGVGKSSRYGQKWRDKDESIHNNLQQYSLQHRYIDVFIADASQLQQLWKGGRGDGGGCDEGGKRNGSDVGDGDGGGDKGSDDDEKGGNSSRPLFDAIITDPPYGIREPTQKVGFKTQPAQDYIIDEELRHQHIPCKRSYPLGDLLSDLLTFAATHLCLGGRLVFWMPVYKPDYTEANVPQHECLELVANCEQSLNAHVARRMITMTKISHFNECVGDGQASMKSDHYADATFRQKYFHSPNDHTTRATTTTNITSPTTTTTKTNITSPTTTTTATNITQPTTTTTTVHNTISNKIPSDNYNNLLETNLTD